MMLMMTNRWRIRFRNSFITDDDVDQQSDENGHQTNNKFRMCEN